MAEAVVTLSAKKKMVKARAGVAELPKIIGMAFGNGGVDAGGVVIAPTDTQNTLNNELLRKELTSFSFLTDTKCRYVCILENNELVGASISEVALYDEDGDLVAIKNFLPKGKDSDLEMTMQIDDEF